MRRLLLSALAAVLTVLALSAASSEATAQGTATVTVVQAVPGATVDVSLDGREVASGAAVGDVLGPFELEAGRHHVSFNGDAADVDHTLEVAAGASSDVVLHLPTEVDGDPVVHSYAAPDGPIGPDEARVLLAHTAAVAPADVRVDGRTVFTHIANGEYADADVPAGSIEVALLPSGTEAEPILRPLDVSLDAGTLSMIYAYGDPRDGSMDVIAHTEALAPDGSVQPPRIDTGSAGPADDALTSFVDARDADPLARWAVVAALVLLAALLATGTARTSDAPRRRPPVGAGRLPG